MLQPNVIKIIIISALRMRVKPIQEYSQHHPAQKIPCWVVNTYFFWPAEFVVVLYGSFLQKLRLRKKVLNWSNKPSWKFSLKGRPALSILRLVTTEIANHLKGRLFFNEIAAPDQRGDLFLKGKHKFVWFRVEWSKLYAHKLWDIAGNHIQWSINSFVLKTEVPITACIW